MVVDDIVVPAMVEMEELGKEVMSVVVVVEVELSMDDPTVVVAAAAAADDDDDNPSGAPVPP